MKIKSALFSGNGRHPFESASRWPVLYARSRWNRLKPAGHGVGEPYTPGSTFGLYRSREMC